MNNNLWPYLSKFATPAEGQLAEGGGASPNDRYWNCVFACVSVALQALGYSDTEPEDMRQLVQPGTHQGSSFERVAAYLQSHGDRWPNLPRIDTWKPTDTIGTFRQMLDKGYVTIFDVWDDQNANVLTGPKPGWGGTHAVLLEACGPTKTTIWNPWLGEQSGQTYDNAYIAAATRGGYVGNLFVPARSIVPQPAPVAPKNADLVAWLAKREANADIRSALQAQHWAMVFGEFITETQPAFWNRGDVAAARSRNDLNAALGEYFKEFDPTFLSRSDIQAGWNTGHQSAVYGEYLKENGA